MACVVLYDDEYNRAVDRGTLDPTQFDYYFLCEGDSWMDRSSIFQLSLPWALTQVFKGRPDRGNRALFINLARFGDTMRSIADCGDGLFRQWLYTEGMPFKFDAVLLSAGGNDFIDAAADPASGNGILHGVHGAPPSLTAGDCYNVDAVDDLVFDKVDPAFSRLYDLVRNSPNPDVPIFLNQYSVPVARNAPAYRGGDTWLYRAFEKNGIPERLREEVTARIFIDLASTIENWTRDRDGVHVVPTAAVELDPADTRATGSSGDWLNEIHPNPSGWAKLARAWQTAMRDKL